MEAERKAFEIKGERTLYCVNITDRIDKLKFNALEAIEAGANALMLNYLTSGISSLRVLAEDNEINVPILAHLDFSGVLYANPWGGITMATPATEHNSEQKTILRNDLRL